MFSNIRAFVGGYKTYIVATLMVLVALVHLIAGDTSPQEFLSGNSTDLLLLANGLGLAALRAGLAKLRPRDY